MVKVIAHRGASAAAPENTVEAFRLALDLGADWVELDVRRSADGDTVIHHDAHLSDGRAIVDTLRSDLPASIPDLPAALDACKGMGVNIEIKNWPEDVDFDPTERVAEAVVAEVGRRGTPSDFLVSCFHLPTIDRVRELDPRIPTAFLHGPVYRTWDDLAAEVAGRGHLALHPWSHVVDRWYMAAARRHGLEVNVWTVDRPEVMGMLIGLGVDGICTNVPDVARAVLDAATGGGPGDDDQPV